MAGMAKGKVAAAFGARKARLQEKKDDLLLELAKVDAALGQVAVLEAEVFELPEEEDES